VSLVALAFLLTSCSGHHQGVEASTQPDVTVGITNVMRRSLRRELTLSSELVPFQEIDVYAKEAGYVKKLYVDYGSRVKAGEVMATLEIPELEAQLEEDKADRYIVQKELAAEQAELAEQYVEIDEWIAGFYQDMMAAESAYASAEAAEKAAQEEIKALQDLLKKQQEAAKKNTQYVGGEYSWPVPGYNEVSSKFGMRIHPILKVNKMHTGIDIPAPSGTKIIAANDGTVLVATYNSGYGNYVCVDHGGGRATLYAHMSKIAVKSGASIKRGDVLGYVGSTGLSTGPHLHFECIDNGVQVDPLKYFNIK